MALPLEKSPTTMMATTEPAAPTDRKREDQSHSDKRSGRRRLSHRPQHRKTKTAARSRAEGPAAVASPSQTSLLTTLLHPDVVPIVLGYASIIAFRVVRTWGVPGDGDGELRDPRALALRGRDELFVCDSENSRIQVFHHPTGRFLRKWGLCGSEPGMFHYPCALHVDEDRVIVLDQDLGISSASSRLQVFSSVNSKYLYRINLPKGSGCPRGLLVDSSNENDKYYVPSHAAGGDIHVHSVTDRDPSTLAYQGCLQVPWQCRTKAMVLQDNQLFVVDWLLDCVYVFDTLRGTNIGKYGNAYIGLGGLRSPQGVAVHGDQVIVSSTSADHLVIFDRTTYQFTGECTGGDALHRLYGPTGLLINPFTNQLFVCSRGNHRITVLE